MNAKQVYDAIEIEEEDSFSGRLVKARLILNAHYMIPKIDLEDGYGKVSEVNHFLRSKIVEELYGEIDNILSKYDSLIHWGLAASSDEKNYSKYRIELSNFFNQGKSNEE